MKRTLIVASVLILGFALLVGCGGPEQKKARHYNKGKVLYEKGQYAKARLEFKNAIQVDPKFADAYYMLGIDALRLGIMREGYANLSRAVELQPGNLNAQTELARLLFQGGAVDKALEKADLVLKTEPLNSNALAVKASALITKKEPDGAISLLEAGIGKGVKTPEVFLVLSAAYGQKNDFKNVERILQQGISNNPKSAGLNVALANAYARNRQPDNAIATWEHVIALEPDRPTHKVFLAGVYWDAGKEDKAKEQLQHVISEDKNGEEGPLLVSSFYIAKKRISDAEQVLLTGIEKNSKGYRLRLAASELFFKTGRPDQGTKVLKDYLSVDTKASSPGTIAVKTALAKVFFGRKELDGAAKYADEVLKENSKNLDVHYLKGEILLAKGDGPGAVAEFRLIIRERPDFIPAYIKVAEGHALNREYGLGTDVLQSGLKVDPKSAPLMKAMAKMWALQKEYDKSEAQLRQVMELNPNDSEARADLGDLYLMKKDFGKAEAEYGELKKKTPDNPVAYVKLASLFASQGKPDRAAAELQQALKLSPDSSSLLASLVQVYLSEKKFAPAIALCENRIKKNDKDAFAYNLLGLAQSGLGDYKKAEEAFTKAIEIQPSWSVPVGNLARLWVSQGKTAEAVTRLEAAVKSDPNNLGAHLLLGQIYSKGREYSKAVAHYDTVLQKQPSNWAVGNDLAYLLAEQGGSKKELERAKDLAQKAHDARPDEPSIQDTLGWILYKQGNVESAYDLVAKAHSKMGDNAAITYHLGMISYKKGNVAEAKEHLKRALQSPDAFDGKEDARKTLQRIGA